MGLAMEKALAFLGQVPSAMMSSFEKVDVSKLKSTEATVAAASIVGTISALQLFTDWDPLGRCFTFWRQLRSHVSVDTGNSVVDGNCLFVDSLCPGPFRSFPLRSVPTLGTTPFVCGQCQGRRRRLPGIARRRGCGGAQFELQKTRQCVL